MVTFLNDYVGDARPVIFLQTDTGLPDGYQLRPRDLIQQKGHTHTHLRCLVSSFYSQFPPLIMNHSHHSCLAHHTWDSHARNMAEIRWR